MFIFIRVRILFNIYCILFVCVKIENHSYLKLGSCHTKIYVLNTECQNIFGAIYVRCNVPQTIYASLVGLELRAAFVNIRNTVLNIVTFRHFQIM